MNTRQTNDLWQAFVASEELDTAAGYVAAGRRYAGLSDSVLERTWASAYMGYYLQGQRPGLHAAAPRAGQLVASL
jgi:hypothetical protein